MTADQKTVIVVEDEPDAAELFAEMMRVSGFRVLKTYSSTPAISMIAKEQPDVVILDIMMPDISGLEVLRFMRRDPKLKATPVIVVSARSMPSDIREGLEAGATIYLTKPVGYLELKKSVDQVVHEQPLDNSSMDTARSDLWACCARLSPLKFPAKSTRQSKTRRPPYGLRLTHLWCAGVPTRQHPPDPEIPGRYFTDKCGYALPDAQRRSRPAPDLQNGI